MPATDSGVSGRPMVAPDFALAMIASANLTARSQIARVNQGVLY